VCLFLCQYVAAAASGTCSMSVVASARQGGSWNDGSNQFQIWDINVTNSGSCAILQASAAVTLCSGSVITQSWNYDLINNAFENFGRELYAQQSFTTAGLIVTAGCTPAFSDFVTQCDPSCASAGTTAAPTSSGGATSSATTSSAASSSGATSSSATSGSTIDTHCQLSVTQTRRSGSGAYWASGGFEYQLFDLDFTNTGSETVTFAQFDQSFAVGIASSAWNMVKTCCTQIDSAASYNVTLPAGGLVPGASTGAGFILQYAPDQTLVDPEFGNPIVQTAFFDFILCM